jgi:hypothetical protein
LRVDLLDEVDFFSLNRHHGMHGVIRVELKISDGLEDLSEMASYLSDFLGLGKDFEQLVIGQEVETSET